MTTYTQPAQTTHAPRWAPLDLDWQDLAAQPADKRETNLRAFYTELGALPEATRIARLRDMVAVTHTLPDEAFWALTESRLRVWLQLDQETAVIAACSYDAVMREVPANAAMRRVAVVQTLLRDFSDAEQHQLSQLNPDERARGSILTKIPTRAESDDGGSASEAN